MRRHLAWRTAFFVVGILLLYAPFALAARLVVWATDWPLLADVHRICLRMSFEWLSQPWMFPTMIDRPAYLIGPVLLPLVALLVGPWFCGWLCPAGSFTELLGRLVPDRFKVHLGGRLDPAPIRYGVLVGMLAAPYLGSYVCCTFCNFTMMQNVVAAAFGDLRGLSTWASFTFLTFVVWFLVLGLFTKGGRGWCNLLCPAGAALGLAHALGARLPFARGIRVDPSRCDGCRTCQKECPAWAIRAPKEVNRHACNLCLDCVHLCPRGAIDHGPLRPVHVGLNDPASRL